MKIQYFYLYTLIFSLLTGVFGSLLIISDFTHEPTLGLFLFFKFLLFGSLVNTYLIFKGNLRIRGNLFTIGLIALYLIVNLSFIINTKNHFWHGTYLILLLILIHINLISPVIENFITQYLINATNVIGDGLTKFSKFIREYDSSEDKKEIMVNKQIKELRDSEVANAMGLSLLIGIPVIGIVLALLSASSDTYSDWLEEIFNFEFSVENLFYKVIFTLFMVYVLCSFYMFIKALLQKREAIAQKGFNVFDDIKTSLGLSLIFVIFILNLFYTLFVVAQLKHDFGDLKDYVQDNNIESFSELAVGRFWELILVSIINLGLLYLGRRSIVAMMNKVEAARYFNFANLIWFLLNTVFLIVSVHQRLYLYVSSYGFTYRRFSAYVFLPFVLIVALLVFYSYVSRRYQSNFLVSFYLMLFALGLVLTLPTTYITNKVNYELAKDERIEVYDPTYNVQIDRGNEVFNNDVFYENNVEDYDGLLVTKEILDEEEIDLNRSQEILLMSKLNDFEDYYEDYDLREWNLIKWLITR